MALHELLALTRDDVMLRWKAQVRGTLAPKAMPPLELEDHIPEFVDEIIAALQMDAGLSIGEKSLQASAIASGHGAQRLRLGFGLDSVVREYGALHDVIVEIVRESGAQSTFRERQVLFDMTIGGIALAVTEYTHQRDAEQLRHANEHFAFVAHELRNPLSSARMAFKLLKNKGNLPADSLSVGALERGLQRTSELIDQTLQIARVASGIELRKQGTTLKALFEDAALGAASDAESKGVEIRTVIVNDQRLMVDIRLVQSAISNLLRNAVKYTCSDSAVEVRGSVANGRITIEVEDRCGGLEPGKVEEAFAPFARIDDQQSGFGLGLAIAKQAADAHGGSIRVQNLPGRGCIFVLELPLGVA